MLNKVARQNLQSDCLTHSALNSMESKARKDSPLENTNGIMLNHTIYR
jgi:hypothetical protein